MLNHTREDIEWLSELPYTIAIPDCNAFIVHAGLLPGVPLAAQSPVHMTRIRNVRPSKCLQKEEETGGSNSNSNSNSGGSGSSPNPKETEQGQVYEGHEHDVEGSVAWSEAWTERDRKSICYNCHVYFGHDAKRQLQLHTHTTGLDTGCCYGE